MNLLPTDRLIILNHQSGDSKFKDLWIHAAKIFMKRIQTPSDVIPSSA